MHTWDPSIYEAESRSWCRFVLCGENLSWETNGWECEDVAQWSGAGLGCTELLMWAPVPPKQMNSYPENADGEKLEVLHLLGLPLEIKSGSFKTLVWWEKYLWVPENQIFQVLGWECVYFTNFVSRVTEVAKGPWRDYMMIGFNVNLPQMGSPEYRDSIRIVLVG